MGRRIVTLCMLALLFGSFLGCDRKPEVQGPRMGTRPQAAGVPVYHFAVHPLHITRANSLRRINRSLTT